MEDYDLFKKIDWNNDFNKWHIIRIPTYTDGNCLFHALANSFFIPYRSGILNNKEVSKSQIARSLRYELSQKLNQHINNDINLPTYYESLNSGNTRSFSKDVPEFELEYMKQQLNSNNPIGYGYMEFIGSVLNKDIYILDGSTKDIYISDELKLTIKGDRDSVVLYYINGHYELIGIVKDEQLITHFDCSSTFIRFLYNKVLKYI